MNRATAPAAIQPQSPTRQIEAGEMDDLDRLIRRAQADAARLADSRPSSNIAPLDALGAQFTPLGMLPPDFLPGYRLEREIHRGGQGIVYHATQLSTRQSVAIKVMRAGLLFGSSSDLRFRREVQILADLRHPQIVPIRDAGEIGGLRYFVMDLVDGELLDQYGEPLDKYVERGRQRGELTLKQILTLFANVCDAVNAAQLRGVIHRDLKPGNILVDKSGTPRLLDFGLAKLVDDDFAVSDGLSAADASAAQSITHDGQFVGSLPWASPEQAAGDHAGVDMRTDVYSLGVLLYHVLTGEFPYDTRGGMTAILDRIRHAEPTRPLFYHSLGHQLPAGSSQPPAGSSHPPAGSSVLPGGDRVERAPRPLWGRFETGRGLWGRFVTGQGLWGGFVTRLWGRFVTGQSRQKVPNELQTITLKCLSKDPARRYQSAGDLAADLRRFLAGEAIEAKRDSRLYVLRKLARRHRVAVFAGLAVAAALAVGAALATYGLVEARRERDRARDQQRVAEGTLEALDRVFDGLQSVLHQVGGRERVAPMLDGIVARLDRQTDQDPRVEAAVRGRLTWLYRGLGDFERASVQVSLAEAALRRASAAADKLHASILAERAAVQDALGDYAGAWTLWRRYGDMCLTAVGESSIGYIDAKLRAASILLRLGNPAEYESETRLAIGLLERYHPDSGHHAQQKRYFADWLWKEQGRCNEALPLLEDALAWARRAAAPDLLDHFLASLGNLKTRMRRFDEAEPIQRECLELRERLYGTDHVYGYYIYVTKSDLGIIQAELGCYEEAETLLLAAYDGFTNWNDPLFATGNLELLRRAAERLVRLYELWDAAEADCGHAESMVEWCEELNELTEQTP